MRNILRRFWKDDAGITFVETLMAIGIGIILSGTLGFMGLRYLDRAKVVSTRSEIQALSMALDSYYLDNGRYPTEDQGLKALWERPSLEPAPQYWSGPYVNKNDFTDSWDNDYEFNVPGESGLPYSLTSLGSDGYPGGEGNAQDIHSWE